MVDTQKNSGYNSTSLLRFLWKWRKPLIIVTGIAAVVSIVVSLLLTEYYRAEVIIFPAKQKNVSFNENTSVKETIVEFGEEEDAEQLLQILGSATVRERIIEMHDLYKHYDIDTSEKFAKTKLSEEFGDNVTYERTRNGAISIEVLDHDPEKAAAIANDIAMILDSSMNEMIRERVEKPLRVVQRQYNNLTEELQSIINKMSEYNEAGVVNAQARTELPAALIEARANGDVESERQLMRAIRANDSLGSSYDTYAELREEKVTSVNNLKRIMDQMHADANIDISHKFTVERASVPEKKAYPIRWLIVVLSTVSAFFFTIMVIIGLERFKEIRAEG